MLVQTRRDFHRFPELAYTEFRTASRVARRLTDLGLEVRLGPEVMDAGSRLGLPPEEELACAYERAANEDGDAAFLPALRGGFTGVVGVLRGAHPGPTVALRVDTDALPILEAASQDHLPAREGFRSAHEGLMHACGHDAHAAIGLGVAEVLSALRGELQGTVKLIFQPGEEGGKGALPMTEAGVVDDVDYLVGAHIGMGIPSGTLYAATAGFLASHKLDATFKGRAAHAGAAPQEGRNALLAAAGATVGLYGISRSSAGASRVNVGVLRAGAGRNVIADEAFLVLETRGENDEVAAYMKRRARAVLEGAALAQEVELHLDDVGSTLTAESDGALAELVAKAAAPSGLALGEGAYRVSGSEDCSYFMRRVQARGGLATYVGIGSDLPSGHHTRTFDVQEADLTGGVKALALSLYHLGAQPVRVR